MEKPNPFLDRYVEQASAQLAPLLGRTITEADRLRIRRQAEAKMVDRPAMIINNFKDLCVTTSVAAVASFLLSRKPHQPIVTGHGTLFKCNTEHPSVIGDMVKMLMDRRKVEKDAMFLLMENGKSPDDPEVKAKDQAQKIFKLLANSYYGAMGEKGFVFYDPNNGPATTYTGQLIIGSTLYGFESFLANNLWLRDRHELARHVSLCLTAAEDGPDLEEEWGESASPEEFSRTRVIDHLVAACAPGWDSRAYAERLTERLTSRQLRALAYRGDPYAFCLLPEATTLLEVAISGEIRVADARKIAKDHPEGKVAIDRLFEGMKKWVMVPHVPGDLPRRIAEMKRSSVVLTDTDSTFLNLGPWMRFLGTVFDMSQATEEESLTGLNILVYMMRLLNDLQMEALTAALGVPADKRGMINFKSEFVIKRMVLTDGKKHYVALMQFQEGVKIEGDKVELKGLAVKKTTVARSTRDHFETAIEERVLRSKEIDRIGLVREVVILEERIREATASGSSEYTTPARLGRFSEYADAGAMPVVRGTTAWNAAFPNNPIREGDRVNLVRIRIGTNAALLAEEMALWSESEEELEALNAIASCFFGPTADESLAKNGFNWLALPKEVGEIPLWARRLIDVDEVIQANTSPILPILHSVGIIPLSRPSPEVYSNILEF